MRGANAGRRHGGGLGTDEHSLDLDCVVALNTGSQPKIMLFLSQTL